MMRAVTFTPLAGLGDNYLQISLLLKWARDLNETIVVIFFHDGYIPPDEQRANSAIHVQIDLLALLAPHPHVLFAQLPGHHPYPYDPLSVHAFSPSVMFDRQSITEYWPLERRKFTACAVPSTPYIAMAFDSVSWPQLKAFQPQEIAYFVREMTNRGYSIVDVGGNRALSEKAYIIDHAAAFVGAASGLAHVAAGLGKLCYVVVPEADHADFAWFTATLRHNGANYQDCVRYQINHDGLIDFFKLPHIFQDEAHQDV